MLTWEADWARAAGGCTLKKTSTAVVVGIYGEGVPHGELLWCMGWIHGQDMPRRIELDKRMEAAAACPASVRPLTNCQVAALRLPVALFSLGTCAGDCNVVVENLADYLIEQS